MLKQIRQKLTFANTIAVLALFIALGGSSVAAPVREGSKQLATKAASAVGLGKRAQKTAKRALRVAKRADRNSRKALRVSSSAGEQGPQGEQGSQGEKGEKGDKGEQGDPATELWAVIGTDGSIVRSKGVFSATRLGVGQFKVRFDRDVRDCSYQATPGGPGTIQPADLGTAFIGVGSDPDLLNGVSVSIRNSLNANNQQDFPFHIAVFC